MKKIFQLSGVIFSIIKASIPFKRIIVTVVLWISRNTIPIVVVYISKLVIDSVQKMFNGEFSGVGFLLVVVYIVLWLLFDNLLSGILEIIEKKNREKDVILISKYIENHTIEKIKSLDRKHFDVKETFDIISRAQSLSAGDIYDIYINILLVSSATISVIGYTVIVVTFNPLLFLMILVLASLEFVNGIFSTKKNELLNRNITSYKRKRDYNLAIIKSQGCMQEIRAYNALSKLKTEYFQQRSKVFKIERKLHFGNSLREVIILTIRNIVNCCVYGYVIFSALLKIITLGDITLIFTAFTELDAAVGNFIRFSESLYDSAVKTEYFSDLLKIENDIIKDSDLRTKNAQQIDVCKPLILEFKNVWFRYPGSEEFILKDINLKITAPCNLALVGANGAGKTTFVKLLIRQYDPTDGKILLNGIDVKEYNPFTYYSLFSVMFQHFKVYNLSLESNIKFSDSPIDQDIMNNAIVGSQVNRFMGKMSDGLNTEMSKSFSDDGYIPSMGEAQRIAIARTLYHERPVAILDEPSASIDAYAEYEIYDYIRNRYGPLIKIMISHRLSNVKKFDKIVLIEDGTISEMGDHQRLMEKKGRYYELYTEQAKWYSKVQ